MSRAEELLAQVLKKEKEECKACKIILWVLAVVGVIAAVAGIAYAVYRFVKPDYLEDYEDDIDDEFDYDDDFFDDEDDFEEEIEEAVEEAAEEVLLVREDYPGKTLAELYDPDKMPDDLREAHHKLDLIVESCYQDKPFANDEERLECLFKLYEKMTNK